MSSRKRVLALVLAGGIAAVWGLKQCAAIAAKRMPSYQRAHASVEQILFMRGRTLVRNELSELFASDDDGRAWRVLSETADELSIANGNEIWGAHGWEGHHEGPSASVWHSSDRGEVWSHADIRLPQRWGNELYSRLPSAFINEPGDPPLLLMADFQLVRPALVADSSTWQRVGRPIEGAGHTPGTINAFVGGCKHGQSTYIAKSGTIFFSGDDGMTWTSQQVDRFADAKIRCQESTCYALLSELGSEWSGLMITEAGTNNWRSVRTFAPADVAAVLTSDHRHPTVTRFGATALLPTEAGIYVAGIVDAGGASWGAVLRVDNAGAIAAIGHGVPQGLWVLEQAPDGTVWAGGQGAYRLQSDDWVPVWSAPKL